VSASRPHSTYLPTLDGWRAVAISLVLLAHTTKTGGLGVSGVQIFFGLSGFLITSLLLSQEARSGSISLRRFYTRRIYRIVPAAAVFLLTVGILSVLRVISITFGRWISALFFMANYSHAQQSWYVQHFWSLAVEEHFYLIWPAVLLLVRSNRKRLTLATSAAIIVAIWRMLDFKYRWFWPGSTLVWNHRTDIQADNILFGVVFALALADKQIGPKLQSILRQKITSFLAILVFASTFILAPYVDWKVAFCLLSVRAISVPVMILSTLHNPQTAFGKALELKAVRFVGLISYSLYLWQELFLAWDPNPYLTVVQRFPLNLAMTFLFATLSFYMVEMPLIRVGHVLSDRQSRPHSRVSQVALESD
jgi:peptidoglycan/LPS O-acetylase OafA/YrhL